MELFWHLIVYKQKTVLIPCWIVWNKTVYMYKMDLILNNLQWLICHKTKLNQTSIDHSIHTSEALITSLKWVPPWCRSDLPNRFCTFLFILAWLTFNWFFSPEVMAFFSITFFQLLFSGHQYFTNYFFRSCYSFTFFGRSWFHKR